MARIPLSVGAILLLGAWSDDRRFVLALPVLTNGVLLAQFALSLRGIPIAERFARAQKEDLSPAQVAYCRSVTIAWCVFFVLNGSVTAALALRAPVKAWAVYSGGVSYGLVGLAFAVEFGVRTIRFGLSGAGLLARMKGGPSARGASSRTARVRGFEPRPVEGRPGAFDVHVPANLAYFQGHFDGHAVLPGVVQVEVLVARQVATTWPELARIRGVTRLRFKRPIRPGDDLVLQITRPEHSRVDFDVRCCAEPCSSGTLHFEV
jgi:acyl dehydratase